MDHKLLSQNANNTNADDFGALLDEFMDTQPNLEHKVLKGTVIQIDQHKQIAVINVGLKSEGRVALKELVNRLHDRPVQVGDVIDVFVERLEDRNGELVLSVEKARRESLWQDLEAASQNGTSVNGVMFGRVKGGFAVDMGGVVAFLPASQVDLRPVRDVTALLNVAQPFKILKIDRLRNNIVVSRRSVLEDSRMESRSALIDQLQEGQVLTGVVKNITDYGAFVDLGGVDGLLHVTDLSWKRLRNPEEAVKVGQTIEVKILRFNKEAGRISLGVKQLGDDPWANIEQRYQPGQRLKGVITNVTDYGAFVELEDAIEGLVHVSELSWTRKNIHPSKLVTVGQDIEVVVLEVHPSKRRLSLGLKQCLSNPWEQIRTLHPIGSELEGVVRNITEFGIFVGVTEELDGMVHLSDISWTESGDDAVQHYTKGQTVRVKVLDIDPSRERISLGIKQLTPDVFTEGLGSLKKNDIVQCRIDSINEYGLNVSLIPSGTPGQIRRTSLAKDRTEQRLELFEVGQEIEAKVMQIDSDDRKVQLSIRAKEMDDEKRILSEMSGGSQRQSALGSVLEEAMQRNSNLSST